MAPRVEATTPPGVIAAGGSVTISTGLLSNSGSTISAGLDVNLNLQSLNNAPVGNATTTTVDVVDQAQLNAFMAQLNALGSIGIYGTQSAGISGTVIPESYVTPNSTASVPPSATSTDTYFGAQGQIIAGQNLTLSGGNLVNGGLLYAGNNVNVSGTQSFSNQGQYNTSTSTQPGCATGVSGTECAAGTGLRGANPATTSFSYAQQSATIYAGNDLVISAGQISNTYGSLLAGHDIVIGGVGTTATSTTPASSLTNTSGSIIAGNNITLNVSGAVTNTLPPPVPVHENYGSKEAYSGCMTAGGYKESYCEGYVDQQSGDSSVISAGNNLQITAGSLTNIGSLIAAGNNATISVAGPVVNEAQTLNAYWHSHWVQETGMFSSDKRHDIWACGSAAECTALYGSAYTSVGGTIDPPQPVGNIAATIQAPNLSISSNGVIQNVGNVIGTNVRLTGQSLINGITTANTYTPRVDGPSQVISLSPVNLPGLKLGTTGSGGTGASAGPGQASYLAGVLGGSATTLGPQQLLSELPASLQPSSTLFYYNPEAEDLMLQQAALKQTGQASFIGGLSYDRTNGLSVTDQEKGILYQNALDYAKQNNLQLGVALSQAQINELSKPMLWYVEQTVPDPGCVSTGIVTCKTVTALMPQVYLPSNSSSALSAGGNIIGQDVTLDFNQDGHGSILNTGTISASNTLTVDTSTLTNRANQVDVGHIWQYIKGVGYSDTTGTQVQPGGFMSAANMDLNVQTLSQIGGALQKLNADGTLDQAGTQQFIESLQQKLGAGLTQTTLSDALHTSFTAQGGFGPDSITAMAFAVVVAVMTYGAASALIGSTIGTAAGSTFAAGTQVATAGLGNIALSAGIAGFASSAASQLTMSGTFNLASAFEAAGVAAITAGLTNGITYSSQGGVGFTTQPLALGGPTSSLAMLAGVSPAIGTTANQAMGTTATLGTRALAMLAEAGISSTVSTAIEGGSFGNAFKNAFVGELAAAAAYKIGDLANENGSLIPENSPQYILTHALVGCAASAAEGTGCVGGAIGGAVGAFLNPNIDPNGNIPAPLENAFTTIASTLIAGALGANVQGAAMAAQNETQNNWLNHVRPSPMALSEQERADNALAACNKGDDASCGTYKSLQALSQQRDADLAGACAGGFGSPGCRSQVAAALAGGNDVHPVNGTMYAFDPNAPAIRAVGDPYQNIYANSFDGRAAQSTFDGIQMAPIPLTGAGVFGKIGSWFGLGAADASRLASPIATLLDGSGGAINNGVAGSVSSANFAQSSINAAGTFSAEGAAKYSELAGVPISTVDDLAAAIKNGLISPKQLPVDYVVTADGAQLILNTRTSVALGRAGIPQSQWYGINQTGIQVPGMTAGTTFNDLAAGQLARNKLPPTGTSSLPKGPR
jgi:filamentous hemagglutinin